MGCFRFKGSWDLFLRFDDFASLKDLFSFLSVLVAEGKPKKEKKKKTEKEEDMAVTGSGSVQPQFISSTGNRSLFNAPLIENSDTDQVVVPDVSFDRN